MIIHNPNIIFIHLPKTGGTTFRYIFGDTKFKRNSPAGSHHSLSYLKIKKPEINIDDYCVVTIARNSWERNASYYAQKVEQFDQGVMKMKPRSYIDFFNEIMKIESFHSSLEIDGKLPKNLRVINFHNFETEVKIFLKEFQITVSKIPITNTKENKYNELQYKIISDPEFQEIISEKCKREIEYFNYSIPA